jgi:putative transposase
MDIHELVTAPRSPWQNAYVERFIGSVRRECLDHVIVCSQTGLRRTLQAYSEYYQRSRTHLALDNEAPVSRRIADPNEGAIVAVPQLGGLHQHYERRAA